MSISTAVIVAAGKGKRMGTEISKQFLPLCGKEILAHTVEKFEKAACIRDIILVTGGDALQDVRQMVQEYGWKKIISVTEGGKERQDSVFLGLQQVPQDTEIVLIHDGVRPFVTEEILERSIAAAKETGGCVAGVPAKDTIKVCEGFCDCHAGQKYPPADTDSADLPPKGNPCGIRKGEGGRLSGNG